MNRRVGPDRVWVVLTRELLLVARGMTVEVAIVNAGWVGSPRVATTTSQL